ncbi:MAG: immunity 22 family protein [Anaerolineae bacterium]
MPMQLSHLWLGFFATEAALETYFEEKYPDDRDDNTPLNRFAQDQGETFYDHDWVEYSFDSSGDLRKLIQGHSYSQDYLNQVIALAQARGLTGANTFIMADQAEFTQPKSIEGEGYRLWYLGLFRCNI